MKRNHKYTVGNGESVSSAQEYIYVLIGLLLGLLLLLVLTDTAGAKSAGVVRPNGCHTYNVGGVFGGVDNTDAYLCGLGTENAADARQVPNKGTVDSTVEPIDEGGVILDDKDQPTQPDDKDTCENGNPGNKKCVGNAGENPNGRGTMDNDSEDGNGEHGNQGVGNPGNGNRGGEHGNH